MVLIKIYYDTEFIEDGKTVELISIGMVAEDGRELYAVNSDAPWDRIKAHDWLVRYVVPSLPLRNRSSLDTYLAHPQNSYPKPPFDVCIDTGNSRVKPHWVIANEVRDFIQTIPDPELWAWYGAYDHVALAWLYGPMSQLPDGIPMWTNDLRQEVARLGLSDGDMPQQTDGHHNALADARHNRVMSEFLASAEAGTR